jgi:hypothetical protein
LSAAVERGVDLRLARAFARKSLALLASGAAMIFAELFYLI